MKKLKATPTKPYLITLLIFHRSHTRNRCLRWNKEERLLNEKKTRKWEAIDFDISLKNRKDMFRLGVIFVV